MALICIKLSGSAYAIMNYPKESVHVQLFLPISRTCLNTVSLKVHLCQFNCHIFVESSQLNYFSHLQWCLDISYKESIVNEY